jgi:hypothetical protein
MPFLVRGFYNNNPLTLTTETEEAFAKAFDWRLVEGFTDALSVTALRLQGYASGDGPWSGHLERMDDGAYAA